MKTVQEARDSTLSTLRKAVDIAYRVEERAYNRMRNSYSIDATTNYEGAVKERERIEKELADFYRNDK